MFPNSCLEKDEDDQKASGFVFHERRVTQKDRRNLSYLPKPASTEHLKLANTQLNSSYSEVEFNGLLRVWITTENVDLLSRVQEYIKKFPTVSVHPFSSDQLIDRYVELADFNHNFILIDTTLLTVDLIELLRTIRKILPAVKIILLQNQSSHDLINEIIEFRISGLLQTEVNAELFLKALRAVFMGEYWFPHELISRIFACLNSQNNQESRFVVLPSGNFSFTKCEQNIINSLVKGFTNKQIAQQICVSPETIKKHLKNIFTKTGARNRSELIFNIFFRNR